MSGTCRSGGQEVCRWTAIRAHPGRSCSGRSFSSNVRVVADRTCCTGWDRSDAPLPGGVVEASAGAPRVCGSATSFGSNDYVTPPEYAWSRERDRVIDSRTDFNRQAHRRREHRDESVPPHPVVMPRHRSVLSGRVTRSSAPLHRFRPRRRRFPSSGPGFSRILCDTIVEAVEQLVRPVSSGHTRHRGHRRRRVPSVSMSRCG